MDAARFDRAMNFVVAMARGDAFPQDVPEHVRQEGYGDLDETIAALGQAARQAIDPTLPHQPIDPTIFARPNPPEMFAETVHRAKLPFLHNGTLFDPQDIARFNGQELHLVQTPGHLLAFSDRKSIARVWELLYVTKVVEPSTNTTPAVPQTLLSDEGPVPIGDLFPEVDEDDVGAHFWEDSRDEGYGSHLFCPNNRGYQDLTEVCKGFLCTGDWNDVISSFRCWSTPFQFNNVCVLYEHVGYWGLTLTSVGSGRECFAYYQLDSVGFNDITSSVGTW